MFIDVFSHNFCLYHILSWFFRIFFMVSGYFLLFLKVFSWFSIFQNLPLSTMQFFAKPWPIFLRFIEHHMQLFSMVANHRSSDAMYRSSLYLDISETPFQYTVRLFQSLSVNSIIHIHFKRRGIYFRYHDVFRSTISMSNEFIVIHFVRKWILFN